MLDHDDYRLTAYVLGELEPADQAEVEAALAESPELRAIVAEIRQADALLGEALQHEPTASLHAAQREAIHAAAVQVGSDLPVALQVSEAELVETAIDKLTVVSSQDAAPWWRRHASLCVNAAAVLLIAATLLISLVYYPSSQSDVANSSIERGSTYHSNTWFEPANSSFETEVNEEITIDFSDSKLESPYLLNDPNGKSQEEFLEGESASNTLPSHGGRDPAVNFENAAPSTSSNRVVKPGYWKGRVPGQEFVGANLADDQPGVYVPAEEGGGKKSSGDRKSEVRSFQTYESKPEKIGAMSEHDEAAAMAVAEDDQGSASTRVVELLEDERARRMVAIQQLRDQLKEIKTRTIGKSGDDQVSDDESALVVPLAQLHSRVTSKEVEQEMLKAQSKAYEEKLNSGEVQDEEHARASLQRSKQRLAQNQLEIDLLREKYFAQRGEVNKKAGMNLDLMFKQSELRREEQVVEKLSGQIKRLSTQDEAEKVNGKPLAKTIKKKPAPKKTSWQRVKAVPNASRLMVGDQDELSLEGMQANVRIDGFRARVIVDYYFYNDRNARLEGTFKLRLPDDASLYYFAFGETSMEYRPEAEQLVSAGFIPAEALRSGGMQPADIFRVRSGTWNNVKEARIVPREKAAHAYSETVRRRIDPALVEWAGAGVFNARVFPLAAKKLHRIVVGYDVNLAQDGDALTYQFQLPEGVPQTVVDVDLAALPGTTAEVTPTTRPFTSTGRAYYHLDKLSDRFVGVRREGADNLLLTGSDESQNDFFATRVTPELKSQERAEGASHAVFLVDTSLSSQPDKFNVWLKLMEATLNENRDSLKEFSTLFFGIDTYWWREGYTANTPENVKELLTYCETLSLEGATDLNAALAEAASPHWLKANSKQMLKADFFLLSDGAVTWGETNLSPSLLAEIAENGSVFAYKTGYTGTDTSTLENLTRATGGMLISVADESEINTAAKAHRQRPWQLSSVSIDGGRDLLIAGRPEMIYAGQPLMIVGRGTPTAGAELVFELKRGSETKSVNVPLADQVPSELAARTYGQVAVGQLEELQHATEDVSVAYARHFRVTGQTCSLLMLDSEADYQRFNIRPEADLQVVLTQPAADLIAAKLKDLGETLEDSKQALLAWLTKLESTPGVQFKLPAAFVSLLEGMPTHVLELPASRLVCKEHTSAAWSSGYAEQLKQQSLNAEMVRFEAQRRFSKLGGPDALKALSSLIEQSPGDTVLTRDVAFSALQWHLPTQAYPLLKRVAAARPFEPQTYLALAQCAAEADRAELAMLYYEIALAGTWNQRYGAFRQIAVLEYQQLLARIVAGELATKARDYAASRMDSMRRETSLKQADLIITAQWNTDRTDVDLHVQEPSGEVCFYSHNHTKSGGRLTKDVTEGFGPEMYMIAQALPGEYRVQMHYYRSDANRTQAATTVYLTVYRNFGGEGSTIERHTVVLAKTNDKQDVLTIKVPESK